MYSTPYDYTQYIQNVPNIDKINIDRETEIATSNLIKIGCNKETTKSVLEYLSSSENSLYLVLFNTFFDDFTNYLSRTTKPPLQPIILLKKQQMFDFQIELVI